MDLLPQQPRSEHSVEQVQVILDKARPKLDARLNKLSNRYHDKRHANEVVLAVQTALDNLADPTVFSDKQKLLLVESARRHDDDHSGNTYRQDVVNEDLSNEERAVQLMKEDLSELGKEDLFFMEKNILATSFGQGDVTKLPPGKESYFRPYKPETDSQKLLAFADVSGFTKGWEEWADESLRLLEESPGNTPATIDAWLANREGFVNFYVVKKLEEIKDLLKPPYYEELTKKLDTLKQHISQLKDAANPDRAKYQVRLAQIRESIPHQEQK